MTTELFTFHNTDCVLYTVKDSIESESYFVFVEETSENPPCFVTKDSIIIETISIDSAHSIDTDMLLTILKNTVVTHEPYLNFTVDSYSVSHSPEKTIVTFEGEVRFEDENLPTTIVLRLE